MKTSNIKKILWLGIIFSLFFTTRSFAALSLTATAKGSTITATLSGVTNDYIYRLIVQTAPVPTSGTYTGSPISPLAGDQIPATPPDASHPGSITWPAQAYTANTTYYVGVAEQTATPSENPFYLPVSATVQTQDGITLIPLTSTVSGNNIIISGKIDTTKIGSLSPTGFTASLQYTTDVPQTGATTLPNPQGPLTSIKTKLANGPQGINDDGTYFWIINHLQPSTIYYIQQTVTDPGGNTKVDVIDHISSDTGVTIAPGSAAETADLNTRSYTLLSKGFPGLTVLPDPDLCAQERAAGQTPQFCDFNDVLNYFMKLIIGICGVVLVFRLMFEGYQIMVSDVPFLKAKAKSGFLTALGGLILALSSYIILNTINPKLVNETVDVAQLSIGVDQTSLDSQTFQQKTGEPVKTQSQYLALADSLSQQQGIDKCIVEATIQVESDWNPADIGCDENSPYSNVPSRRAYLQSGINYDGSTFTPTTDTSVAQRNPACTFSATKPGYGLDWRFSKGGGLMQVTITPADYKSASWYSTSVESGGTDYNNRMVPYPGWETLIKPETNITRGIGLLKEGLAACNNSIDGTFRYYQTGSSCTAGGTLVNATVAKKMSIYSSCEGGQQS